MTALPGWTPLALVALLYLWQMAEYWASGQRAMAIVFFSYTLGNCGFILDFMRRAA